MAAYLNASLGQIHEWCRFVDLSVVTVRKRWPNCLTNLVLQMKLICKTKCRSSVHLLDCITI